jgi:hypothetical protein
MVSGPVVDREAPLRFLRTAFQPEDWVAILLKSYDTGQVVQRVGPLQWVMHPKFQAWLRFKNARRFNVYVGLNSLRPGSRSRRQESICAVRHVFVEADHDAPAVLKKIAARLDLPLASYVLHSSTNRVHVFWRADGFSIKQVEVLQKHLARELGTDPAATSASQATRLAGFVNHKHSPANLVTIDYHDTSVLRSPSDFPIIESFEDHSPSTPPWTRRGSSLVPAERARHYLAKVPPAIAGKHGDLHTFRVCCRLTRGFDLDVSDAVNVLAAWNDRCQPPWSPRELLNKLRRARRYGREPIRGML